MPPRLNIPPVTRLLLILLFSQSILSFAIRYRQWTQTSDVVVAWLIFVPHVSLIYPWTLVTTTLVENNVVMLAIAGATIFYGGRYLERAWTSAEFAKFLVVASIIPNVICVGLLLFFSVVTGSLRWTLTAINGTIPLQISFLVAFSQLVPTHTVTLFKGLVSLRVPRFPLLHILGVSLLSTTPILSAASFLQVTFGFITSWTYLRFYRRAFPDLETAQGSLRGDASETFAFTEFFPDATKPWVAVVSNQIYYCLVTLRICTPFSAADVSASRNETFMSRGTPGSARAEAERRRALALKALDQRLHAATAQGSKTTAPPPAPAGPSIQIQPQPNVQAPAVMLGETNYAPESEDGKMLH